MAQTALITGVLGQDGSLLADFLLARGYTVAGIVRPGGQARAGEEIQKKHLLGAVKIFEIELLEDSALRSVLRQVQPDEFYHLAACHHSSEHGLHFQASLHNTMLETNFMSTGRILHALMEILPQCRFLYAATSQLYTPTRPELRIDESSPHQAPTYYGLTKALSKDLIRFFREKHGLWACTAILFNHESLRRSPSFLSRKVTQSAALAAAGKLTSVELRDIGAWTDWSAAEDFVEGMHLMLNAERPDDYVLASGILHSVEQLVETAFSSVGLDWTRYVTYQKKSEGGNSLVGDSSRIRRELGWNPTRDFKSMIEAMVKYDSSLLGR